MRDHVVNEALTNWDLLNDHVNDMSEKELQAAINVEVSYDRRKHFLIRLHARYCKLRNARERTELLRVCK